MEHILLGLLFLGPLAFLSFVPSDDPKSLRSQVQNMIKDDFMWKYLLHLALWGGGAVFILFALMDIYAGW
ncbi:hypothetical protein [uncultured Oscillibacter sp.]|uniref:hypothetical protein n=1 Tax=uncultured Oscillibacter sp. TaxID=876091 RepID=UPI0025D03732|nr:hypothetical protein [uncultured Oscillibacter sp.]